MSVAVIIKNQIIIVLITCTTYCKTEQETRLPNSRVTNKKKLEEVIAAKTQYTQLHIMHFLSTNNMPTCKE